MEIKINPDIFRAYDIRGIFPSTINEDSAYLIGRAFVKFLKKPRPNVVVGRDNRLSSPTLFKSLIKGLTNQGAKVIDIGLSTTPMLYWTCAHYNFDGGIMITASHLGKEFNGFKLVREKAISINKKTGLKKIQKLTRKLGNVITKPGKIIKKKVLKDYLEFNLKDFDLRNFRKLKIVIDTANAVPGILTPELKKKLPIQIYSLFEKLDGNFPNHLPDPLIKENLSYLQKEVKNKKANLGVAFDGDGDRVIFVDEKGEVISGDLITAFLVNLILKINPGAKILYDIRSSKIVEEVIKKGGGKAVVWKIGHSFIKEKMRKENIFFAGEFSGHYYTKKDYFSEAPLFVLLKILEVISQTKKNLSFFIKPLKKYFHSGEINFKVKDKKKILKILEEKFNRDGKVLEIDGLRIDFKDWWFLARSSGTENLLRLVVEAKTKKLMEKRKKELISFIKNYGDL
ncbi:MAG: phosphomannomutase/phosphoglucomutase [Patescibacteria group bacterium]|nr:phosphomannomutase/phosphoglucomutase [Patescibacteria group bacterium]